MAESMQDIKRRIKSISSTEHITNAMKLVASAKFRKSKLIFDRTNEYLEYVTSAMNAACASAEEIPSKYLKGDEEAKKVCYIVITSNKGLCGAFNTNVIKRAEQEIKEDKNPCNLVTVGLKGRDYFQKRNYEIFEEFLESSETIKFQDAKKLAKPVIDLYNKGEIDEIVVVYTKFINTMHQEVTADTLLPLELDKAKGEKDTPTMSHQVEYAPSPKAVLDYLIPEYVELELYRCMMESSVCEFIGRRVAMENATDNAQDMLGKLSLNYNRARQSAITNELIEIVAGAEALK